MGVSTGVGVAAFAEEVGAEGPVTAVGGRTHWTVGGDPAPGTREVRAPAGIVAHDPGELTVRCGAATTVAELAAALADHDQECPLDPVDPAATVGGVLAVGRSGVRRLGLGPVRDLLLEARYVSTDGRVVKAGGPTVKNVSGFDLCRLLVGSLGTLGLLGEVLLRCRPRPAVSRWFAGDADPERVCDRLYRPAAVLWDGTTTWALLEGHPGDVESEAARLGLPEVAGPPPLPAGGRLSRRPDDLLPPAAAGRFVAEVGVGVVHTEHPVPPAAVSPRVAALNNRIKAQFDPTGRLNPGRDPLAR